MNCQCYLLIRILEQIFISMRLTTEDNNAEKIQQFEGEKEEEEEN